MLERKLKKAIAQILLIIAIATVTIISIPAGKNRIQSNITRSCKRKKATNNRSKNKKTKIQRNRLKITI